LHTIEPVHCTTDDSRRARETALRVRVGDAVVSEFDGAGWA
jgi:hypothetical protein